MRKYILILLLLAPALACQKQLVTGDIACHADLECPTGDICGEDGFCRTQPKCAPGSALCNGECLTLNRHDSCGACPSSSATAAHQGACADAEFCNVASTVGTSTCATFCKPGLSLCGNTCNDLTSDGANCGACTTADANHACDAGSVCLGGSCQLKCQTGLDICGGRCVDKTSDRANCGTCSNQCPSGQICSTGSCIVSCLAGEKACPAAGGQVCTDTTSDSANCGFCGVPCDTGKRCVQGTCALSCQSGLDSCGGKCVDKTTDRANCGTCGNACGQGLVCLNSHCSSSCPSGQAACLKPLGGGVTASICADLTQDPHNCSSCNNACAAGQACVNSTCTPSCQNLLALCPADVTGTCVNEATDNNNCGLCGKLCAAGTICVGSQCLVSCQAGQQLCGSTCVNTATDRNNCGACAGAGGIVCKAGEICNGTSCVSSCPAGSLACPPTISGALLCIDPQTDNLNCGKCGNACGAGTACTTGSCQPACASGQIVCGTSSICTNKLTDRANCGGCAGAGGTVCADGTVCNNGTCQSSCAANLALCAADNLCHDLQNDAHNCGKCAVGCYPGQICSGGSCTTSCGANQTLCGAGAASTCTNTTYDPANCGGCAGVSGGVSCGPYANATALCSSSSCVASCQVGFADCDGKLPNGCETSITADPANCGACGNVCTAADNVLPVCTSGKCGGSSCRVGFADCDGNSTNGCESDKANDSANCGGCPGLGGAACSGSTPVCSAGICGTTLPAGVMQNVPVAALTSSGLVQCYAAPYGSAGAALSTILQNCPGVNLVLGCRATGSSTLLVAAEGPRALAFSGTLTANGVTFYQTATTWGFSPAGAVTSDLSQGCDSNGSSVDGFLHGAGSERVCWNLTGGTSLGAGARCGDLTSLNSGTTYERVIFN